MKLKLPHSDKMILIDEILEFGNDFIYTKTTIRTNNAFLDSNIFYTYKGIEIMAQSLGAFKGLHANDDFTIGFLLGAREFEIFIPHLQIGNEIITHSKISMQDESGFGVWDSKMFVNNKLVAKASLSVLSPSKEMFLEMKNG